MSSESALNSSPVHAEGDAQNASAPTNSGQCPMDGNIPVDDSISPWPCIQMAQYPVADDWDDAFPLERLSGFQYDHIKNAVHALFLSPALAKTYAQLRDFAFQQGAFSNANRIDLEFFHNILTHDYPFITGNKQIEIRAAFQIDSKKARGMGHLRASHFGLYRVGVSGMGFAELHSLLDDGIWRAFFGLGECPATGSVVFCRLMPVGFVPRSLAYSVVEPWETVVPDHVDHVVAMFRRQFDLFRTRFPKATVKAFLKASAYPLYEYIESCELRAVLQKQLDTVDDELHATTTTLIFPDVSQMPKIDALPLASPVKDLQGVVQNLATAPIFQDDALPETLREAILSREKRALEITTFARQAGAKYVEECIQSLPKRTKIIQKIRILDENEMYRALRHLFLR